MIGHVIMEIEPDEMCAAVAFYLNRDVFDAEGSLRIRHKAVVTEVHQHSNGNFIIEFDGWTPAKPTVKDSPNDAT